MQIIYSNFHQIDGRALSVGFIIHVKPSRYLARCMNFYARPGQWSVNILTIFYNFGPLSSHEILYTRGSIWNDTNELPPDPVVLTCEVCYEWPGLQPQQGHWVNSWRLQYLWKFTTDLLFTELRYNSTQEPNPMGYAVL